jgi:hypothetical protein
MDQADQLTSRDSWRDSFKRFMKAIEQETPVGVLRSSSLVPTETVPPDLFNASFVSIWVCLTEREQNEIVRYLEHALRNSNAPDIIKLILNLVEFVERCDVVGYLPLDYGLLAERAFQVKAYAKAIHYIEEQFHAVVALGGPNLLNTVNGIFNGVGGVSGAGGGASLSARSISASMASMSSQQLQRTLTNLLEQLVTLNHELQQTEAAMGVLDFSSKYLKSLDSQSHVKIKWYEKLHQWQKALLIYEKELNAEQPRIGNLLTSNLTNSSSNNYLASEPSRLTENRLQLLMGRMRCLKGLGDWNRLHLSCDDLLKMLNNIDNPESDNLDSLSINKNTAYSSSNRLNNSSIPFPSSKSIYQRQPSIISSPSNSNIENVVHIGTSRNMISSPSIVGGPAGDLDSQTSSYLYQLSAQQRTQLKEKISEIGAVACWGLGDWSEMKNYVKNLPENSYEGSLYSCVLELSSTLNNSTNNSSNSYSNIQNLIEKTRDLLDYDLTSMASQSYERSYQGIIEAQILAELEEVIKYKQSHSKRDWIEDIWWRRLQGCERSFEYWHRLLLVRSIVLSKHKDIRTWLKFSSLCQRTEHVALSEQILENLMPNTTNQTLTNDQDNPNNNNNPQISINTLRNQELCKYVMLKSLYAKGNTREAYEKMSQFIDEILRRELTQIQRFQQFQQQQVAQQQLHYGQGGGAPINIAQQQLQQQQMQLQQQFPAYFQVLNQHDIQKRRMELETQLAKCYLKQGQWFYDLEGFSSMKTISQIIQYYESAKNHNSNSYKAWQAWAYANYEAIQFHKSNNSASNPGNFKYKVNFKTS